MIFIHSFSDWFNEYACFIHSVSPHDLLSAMLISGKSREIKIHFLPSCSGRGRNRPCSVKPKSCFTKRYIQVAKVPAFISFAVLRQSTSGASFSPNRGKKAISFFYFYFLFIVKKFQELLSFEMV